MTEYPKIIINGKAYFQIGCVKCEFPSWTIYTDKKEYYAICTNCGHLVKLNPLTLKSEPERIKILTSERGKENT